MKKLMFAAAAIAAGVAVADVTSANIVGYMNQETSEGSALVTSPFVRINDTESFKITDLKVTGYREAFESEGETIYEYFSVTKMDENGFAYNDGITHPEDGFQLTWYDKFVNGEWIGGYWYDAINGSPAEPITDETAESLDYGSALLIDVQSAVGEVAVIESAGAVSSINCAFDLTPGSCIVGNPMPTPINLFNVGVEGYRDAAESVGEYIYEYLTLTKIDENGFAYNDGITHPEDAFQLTWYDKFVNDEWIGGFWYDAINGSPAEPITLEDEIVINPGEGWIADFQQLDEEVVTIEFPSPIAKPDAE